MMKKIQLIKYSNIGITNSPSVQTLESFLPITCELNFGNVYGLISDFGCGALGLSSCILGNVRDENDGDIMVDNKRVSSDFLKQNSEFISNPIWEKWESYNTNWTTEDCVKYALKQSQLLYDASDIKKIFTLSDSRYYRPIKECSGEIWNISLAILFALNKKLISFPWLNIKDIHRFIYAGEFNILNFLKKENVLVLVPTNHKKNIKKYCDHFIEFDIKSNKKGEIIKSTVKYI